jgi:hypothetical protein
MIMNLSQAYLEWREATLQEAQRQVVEENGVACLVWFAR